MDRFCLLNIINPRQAECARLDEIRTVKGREGPALTVGMDQLQRSWAFTFVRPEREREVRVTEVDRLCGGLRKDLKPLRTLPSLDYILVKSSLVYILYT